MKRFTRRTNAHSKKFENHVHAVNLHFLHYNSAASTRTIRCTPAMEAGLTDTLHDMEWLMGRDREIRLSLTAPPGPNSIP